MAMWQNHGVRILTHKPKMKRVLIVGSGDVAKRLIPTLIGRYQLFALVRNPLNCAELRALGVQTILGDLDQRHSLNKLAGLAEVVLHFAPPLNAGERDQRTRNLLASLSRGRLPRQVIYISTTGVYGDCAGEWIDETRPVNPSSSRSRRRVDAEQQIRQWAMRHVVRAAILRAPGIYAAERLPLERIKNGMPAIIGEQDGYSNHIHADDLASIVRAILRYGKSNRVYQASDGGEMKMGDYFDVLADAFAMPRPPRRSRNEVQGMVSPMMWSFMSESRRLSNRRVIEELKVKLQYPDVYAVLRQIPGLTVDSRHASR
jgi:nucleoside-diphosphate-sugar epimerase